MSLQESVIGYVNQPFPLWEYELTTALVNHKWVQPGMDLGISPGNYTTVRWLRKGDDQTGPLENKIALSSDDGGDIIYLEPPSFEHLQEFYEEHGLVLASEPDLEGGQASSKMVKALNILAQLPQAYTCIRLLVRCIQVVQQPMAEIDVSYSHPGIPFSIFVSVCQDNSPISDLRVAESILHESMHLKLTLIEGVRALIKPNASGLYFSPWRDELRPAQGVLHGLFVFRAILDFYHFLLPGTSSIREREYVANRIDQINDEIRQLKPFLLCEDLTTDGAILTGNLLPSS